MCGKRPVENLINININNFINSLDNCKKEVNKEEFNEIYLHNFFTSLSQIIISLFFNEVNKPTNSSKIFNPYNFLMTFISEEEWLNSKKIIIQHIDNNLIQNIESQKNIIFGIKNIGDIIFQTIFNIKHNLYYKVILLRDIIVFIDIL